MSRPGPVVQVMIEAARRAGRSLLHDFGESEALQVSRKGPGDLVSSADLRAEKIIFGYLTKMRPGYGFLLEERGIVEGTDSSHRFIIDPLDGTLNFLHGIGHFAVSIALERDGELRVGVVHDVMRNEVFWAETDCGCWLEQRRMRVGGRRRLADAVVACGQPERNADSMDQFAAEIRKMSESLSGLRRFGSAALDLAHVAAARLDGFWERGLKPWDIAAGIVLVREAGGVVHSLSEGEAIAGDLLTSNKTLAGQLLGCLQESPPVDRGQTAQVR